MKIYRGGFTYGRAPLGPHASCVHEVSRYGVHARRVRSQAHTANGSASYFHRRTSGNGESYEGITEGVVVFVPASGRNNYVLLPSLAPSVGHGSRMAARFQPRD